MPSLPRKAQVDPEMTPYYHCVSRCVRRAFLCGKDPYSGESFEHRRHWFTERLQLAAEVFAIDVCAFAIMSNHFHAILRIDRDKASAWSDEAVLRRYAKFFPNVATETRALPPRPKREKIEVLRGRLTELGWFMRVINEHVARRANKEDKCSGRFWEGRFRSQPLLDDAAILASMSYVDLNPVRAGMARSLDGSEFTSVKQRLVEAARSDGRVAKNDAAIPLVPLRGEARRSGRRPLDYRWDDYLALLEWTGRAVGDKSRGKLSGAPPPLLASLHIDRDAWLATMRNAGLSKLTMLGSPASIDREADRRGKRWLKGKGQARALYAESASGR